MEEHKENKEEIKINHDNTPDKPNKSGKGLTVALVIVIILAITAIVGTWYYMNNKANKEKQAQDAQIQQLQKQVDELKKLSSTEKTTNESSVSNQLTSETTYSISLPSGWSKTQKNNNYAADINNTYANQNGDYVNVIGGFSGFGYSSDLNWKFDIIGKNIKVVDFNSNYCTSGPDSPFCERGNGKLSIGIGPNPPGEGIVNGKNYFIFAGNSKSETTDLNVLRNVIDTIVFK